MQLSLGVASIGACGGANPTDIGACFANPGTAAPAAASVPSQPLTEQVAAQAPVKGGKKKPPPPTAAELAAAAVATLQLPDPKIGSAPCTDAGCMGAVGVPVWLWTQPWTTKTATATIRDVSITATARITKVTWTMGDGSNVVCTSRGTPFHVSYGFNDSPDCGYRYAKTSVNQPGMRYPVTATATWNVTWDGDETGATTTTTLANTDFTIGEYQTTIIN